MYSWGQSSLCFRRCVPLRQLVRCQNKSTFLSVHEASQPWISCWSLAPPTVSMPHYNNVYYWQWGTQALQRTQNLWRSTVTIAPMSLIGSYNSEQLSSRNSLELLPTHAHYPSWSMHNTLFFLQSVTLHAPVSNPASQPLCQDHTPTRVSVPAAPNCSFGSALMSPVDHTTASKYFCPGVLAWGG